MAVSKPELDANGEVCLISGCLLDISERKHLEAMQQKRLDDSEEHKRQQDMYLDFTSHEVRVVVHGRAAV